VEAKAEKRKRFGGLDTLQHMQDRKSEAAATAANKASQLQSQTKVLKAPKSSQPEKSNSRKPSPDVVIDKKAPADKFAAADNLLQMLKHNASPSSEPPLSDIMNPMLSLITDSIERLESARKKLIDIQEVSTESTMQEANTRILEAKEVMDNERSSLLSGDLKKTWESVRRRISASKAVISTCQILQATEKQLNESYGKLSSTVSADGCRAYSKEVNRVKNMISGAKKAPKAESKGFNKKIKVEPGLASAPSTKKVKAEPLHSAPSVSEITENEINSSKTILSKRKGRPSNIVGGGKGLEEVATETKLKKVKVNSDL